MTLFYPIRYQQFPKGILGIYIFTNSIRKMRPCVFYILTILVYIQWSYVLGLFLLCLLDNEMEHMFTDYLNVLFFFEVLAQARLSFGFCVCVCVHFSYWSVVVLNNFHKEAIISYMCRQHLYYTQIAFLASKWFLLADESS